MNRRILFSVLILFLIVSFADAAGFDSQSIVSSEKLRSREVILNRFQSGQERVKILIRLAEPALSATVDWNSSAAVGQMRARISSEQTAILSKLTSAEFVLRNRYENFEGFSGEISLEGLNKLLKDPAIASVEPVTRRYPLLAQGIPLINGGQPYRSAYRGQGVAVAICDSGVDYTHPMLGNGSFPNNKVIGGYDFGDYDSDPMPNGEAHGTACAGIAAGSLGVDGDYIGGVAYGAKIYALKVTPLNFPWAFDADIIASWDWCISHKNDDPDNPILIISVSMGGGRFFDSVQAANSEPFYTAAANRVVAAGITLFAASGNDGFCDSMSSPAAHSSVISVGAVYDADVGGYPWCVDGNSCAPTNPEPLCPSGFSSLLDSLTWADKVTVYSNTASFLDILAPSNDAYTTDIVGSAGYSTGNYDSQFGGTSAACPYAAGAAASIQSAAIAKKGRYLSPSEVKALLIGNGDYIADTKVAIIKPRVNLGNTIDSMVDSLAPEPNPPQWQVVPTATGLYTIAMEAKAATDDGAVEYMFECITDAAYSSGWQSSPVYERGDFTPGTSYTFRLRVRDNSNNMTLWSTEETTTTAAVVDNLPPAPNPSQWAVKPRKFTDTMIGMTAKISTDENGPVEYRFECTSHPAYTRDWSTSYSHLVPGLSYDTYTFTVQARDSLLNATAPSSPASVTLAPQPAVLEVPSALYPTIQSAINAASDGDTVLVHAGTYTGPGNRELDFQGKAITVRCENPGDPLKVAATIIDCQRSGRAFDFHHGEGSDSVVAGFTIRNGLTVNVNGMDSLVAGIPGSPGLNGLGGAIRCTFITTPSFIGSSPTIRYCVITNCIAQGGNGGNGSGGAPGYYGVPGDGSTLVPPIEGGSDGGNSGSGYGGGIYCDLLCSPIIQNCKINDCNAIPGNGGDGGDGLDENTDPDPNLAFSAGDGGNGGNVGSGRGGGIYCVQTSQATIINCTITNCSAAPYTAAGGAGGTGGIGTAGSNGSIGSQGSITGMFEGGGVYLQRAYTNTISDTEISQSYAQDNAGGIYCGSNSALELINCDILNNDVNVGSAGGVWYGNGGSLTFDNCKVNQNQASASQRGGGLYGGVGGTGPTVIINNSTFDGNFSQYGGGIYLDSTDLTINNGSVISDNRATNDGGGICLVSTDFIIDDSIISGNTAEFGGGVYWADSIADINNCTISGNLATGTLGSAGAGLYCDDSSANIINCVIQGNDADDRGGAICLAGPFLPGGAQEITNCLINGNTASSEGAGICCDVGSMPKINNCTLTENTASFFGSGGGVSCYDAFVEIVNSILWDNFAEYGPQIAIGSPYETNNPTATVMLYYSDIQGGEDDVFIGAALDPFTGPWLYLPFPASIIDADPLFVSANQLVQTYYLSQVAAGQVLASSPNPCVDTGLGTASAFASIVGFEPTTRTDHVADSGTVDMGYHYRVTPITQYLLEIEVVNTVSGTNGRLYADWRVYGVDMNMADPNTAAINPGTQVQLRAVPDDDYLIKQWTGTDNDATTSTRNTVTMYGNTKVTVEFFYHPSTNIIVGAGQDFQTIAPAIAVAYDKDTIIIKPGTYAGPNNVDIDFKGKAITIRGEDPSDPAKVAATVINCGGTEMNSHRGFIFRNGEDANSVLAGLTITNGFIAGAYGGVYIDPNGVVYPGGLDAFGDGYGGAIFIENRSSPTIKNCVITNCTVTGGYGGHGVDGGINSDGDGINGGAGGNGYGDGYGGAIYCDAACSPIVIGCSFINNRVSGGVGGDGGDGGSPGPGNGVESSGGAGGFGIGFGYGAAIYFDRQASPDINDCQFTNNIATGGAGGVGGKIGSGDPNTPRSTDGALGFGFGTGTGGGVYYGEQCVPYVVDSTFNGNAAYDVYYGFAPIDIYENFYRDLETYYRGGGIHVEVDSKDACIWNCDFTDNLGGGVYVVSEAQGVDVYNCNFIRNTATLNGGGMYVGPACVDVNFVDCEFSANNCDSSGSLGAGGGGLNCKSDVMLDYCSFSANTTVGYGGAINCYFDDNTKLNQSLDSCSFVKNSSTIGGAVYFKNFDAVFADCYVLSNTAEHAGGMRLVYGSLDMNGGAVNNNTATAVNADGGGLACVTVSGTITNYMFCENSATSAGGSGGAVYLSSNISPSIVNCLFADNLTKGDGGAVAVYFNADAHITNSTFSKNWADVSGGGIYCDWESSAAIKDCIFDKCYNYAVYESRNTGTEVTYSLFNNNPHGAFYGFGDSGLPVDYNDAEIDGVSESDVALNIGRTQEDDLKLFVTGGPLGDYYLNQDAGENPAIDGGSAVSDTIFVTAGTNMGDYTTDVDNVLDGGSIVDIGYHYPNVGTLNDFEVTAQVYGGDGYVDIITPPNGNGRYYTGTVVTIKATPRSGWRVRAWYGTDDDSSTATTNTVVVSFSDKYVGVEFEQAAIFEVGPDGVYHTIQEAIYYAKDGDVVVVDTGTWMLPGQGGASWGYLLNKSITIRSKHPDDPNWVAATILDGSSYPGPILILGPDTDSGTIINGLTFQNCHWGIARPRDASNPGENGADGGGAEAGAILISPGAGPVIKNCVITDNSIFGGDGSNGADADQSHNAGRGGWAGWARGGAIYCGAGSTPTFINCQITGNEARGGTAGNGGNAGGLGSANYGGNWSSEGNPGFPVFNIDPRNLNIELVLGHLWRAWTDMAPYTPLTNPAGYIGGYRWYSAYGGGVYCDVGSRVTFTDCVISNNNTYGSMSGVGGANLFIPMTSYEIPSYGGGIYCAAGSNIEFTGCTIADNTVSVPEFIVPTDPNSGYTFRIDPYLGHGGGVCAEDTAVVTFNDCVFRNNQAPRGVGGALYFDNANLRVSDCDFVSNTAIHGGGLYGVRGKSTMVTCNITGNDAVRVVPAGPNDVNDFTFGEGGGLHFWATASDVIDSQILNNNSDGAGGGAYFGGQNSPALINCLVAGNTAASNGGGISVNILSQLSVFNCTVADNVVTGVGFTSYYGGGLNCYDGAYADIVDSIIWGNVAQTGRQIAIQTGGNWGPSEVSVVYSDIQNGAPAIYVDLADPVDENDDSVLNWDDTGDARYPTNLNGVPSLSNPLFRPVPGYYYLSQIATGDPAQTTNSPCVDRGSVDAASLDFYRHTTRTDRAFDTGLVDMGYHYILTADIVGDYNFDGRVDDIDLAIFNLHWLEEGCVFPDWCQGTDLNYDGVVNYLDYAIFAAYYGGTEMEPPKPDPMTWAAAPSSSGQTSIIMSATRAFDNSGFPVEYYFECYSGNCHDSGWLNPAVATGWSNMATLTWMDSGLQPNTLYGYRVKARDVKPNPSYNAETDWSVVGYAKTNEPPPDLTPPSPDPMQWIATPPVVSSNSVTMTAVTATDNSGVVQYYFEETSGNTGGDDSGWQSSPVYTDANLTPSTTYVYRVRARDGSNNSTAWSVNLTVTTLATGMVTDTMPPLPDPSQWAIWPTIDPSTGWHYMQAVVASDVTTGGNDPPWYYFDCVVGSGIDSGWQLSNTYTYYHTSACYYQVRTCDSIPGSVPPQPNPANAGGWSPAGYTGY